MSDPVGIFKIIFIYLVHIVVTGVVARSRVEMHTIETHSKVAKEYPNAPRNEPKNIETAKH